MDEIEKRLRDATDSTVKFYSAWRTQQKDGKAREELMEAVHELRKIAARLEIEIAVSERNEMSAKPIPIPPHRASRKRPGEDMGDDEGNDNGNSQPNFNRQEGGQQGGGGDRPRGDRPQHGGGGGHQGGPRRRTLGTSGGGGGSKGGDE